MLTITEVSLPASAEERLWRERQELLNAYNRELIGGPQWDVSPEAALIAARADPERMRRFIAHLDGEPVGWSSLRVNETDDPACASVFVGVDRRHRRKGIGRALAEQLRTLVGGFERAVAWAECAMPAPGQATVSPPSGIGSVGADSPQVILATLYGFVLAQVERVSRYDFAAPRVEPEDALAEARERAGAAYEVVAWEGPADEEKLADLAVLRQRMSTDAPAGALTAVVTKWDAQRLRKWEAEALQSYRVFRTVVRHRPSGTVVALNELMVPLGNSDAFLEQWDTIVLPEHRGHRLGMLTKAANLLQVREAVPAGASIMTWNAEENRHMLSINEALGYYPVMVEAGFERSL